jgi:hypothetical protein
MKIFPCLDVLLRGRLSSESILYQFPLDVLFYEIYLRSGLDNFSRFMVLKYICAETCATNMLVWPYYVRETIEIISRTEFFSRQFDLFSEATPLYDDSSMPNKASICDYVFHSVVNNKTMVSLVEQIYFHLVEICKHECKSLLNLMKKTNMKKQKDLKYQISGSIRKIDNFKIPASALGHFKYLIENSNPIYESFERRRVLYIRLKYEHMDKLLNEIAHDFIHLHYSDCDTPIRNIFYRLRGFKTYKINHDFQYVTDANEVQQFMDMRLFKFDDVFIEKLYRYLVEKMYLYITAMWANMGESDEIEPGVIMRWVCFYVHLSNISDRFKNKWHVFNFPRIYSTRIRNIEYDTLKKFL